MCLRKVDKKITIRKGVGYKIVREDNRTCRNWAGVVPVFLFTNEWVHDTKPIKELIKESGKTDKGYKPGFHVFLKKEDAFKYGNFLCWYGRVVKVRFYNVVAQGEEGYFKIVVARNIKIIEGD